MPSSKPFLSFLFGSLLDNSGRTAAAAAAGPTLSASKSSAPNSASSPTSISSSQTAHAGSTMSNMSVSLGTSTPDGASTPSSLSSSDYFYTSEMNPNLQIQNSSTGGFSGYGGYNSSYPSSYSSSPAPPPAESMPYLSTERRNSLVSVNSSTNISGLNAGGSISNTSPNLGTSNSINTGVNALSTSPGSDLHYNSPSLGSHFHPSSPGEKWWVGGRTMDGRERYYRLEPLRKRSFDRISFDRISI